MELCWVLLLRVELLNEDVEAELFWKVEELYVDKEEEEDFWGFFSFSEFLRFSPWRSQ